MARCVLTGLTEVPTELLEVGEMAGCTATQRLLWIELPAAKPIIMVGLNQTTMAALSMVITASIIGGFDDVGWAILSGLRQADLGKSLLSGLVIVLLSIVIDRITADCRPRLGRHAMGMVFQNFGLLPHLNVLQNIAFPLRVQGIDVEKRNNRAREMTELVGLKGLEGQFPNQLSGGQQQRVGIARSLAVGPQVWLLDEPFSALDPLIRRQMQDEFIRLQTMLRKTIVFVTHDVQEAFRLADRIAIMRDGAIVQMGRPAEIALSPANDYIAEFLRDIPLLRTVKAADVMKPLVGEFSSERAVPADELVEDILPWILDGVTPIGVLDKDGALIGQVSTSLAELLL